MFKLSRKYKKRLVNYFGLKGKYLVLFSDYFCPEKFLKVEFFKFKSDLYDLLVVEKQDPNNLLISNSKDGFIKYVRSDLKYYKLIEKKDLKENLKLHLQYCKLDNTPDFRKGYPASFAKKLKRHGIADLLDPFY